MPTNKKKEKALEATPITDFHGRRRELLKIGVEQGYLDWKQLDDAFSFQALKSASQTDPLLQVE